MQSVQRGMFWKHLKLQTRGRQGSRQGHITICTGTGTGTGTEANRTRRRKTTTHGFGLFVFRRRRCLLRRLAFRHQLVFCVVSEPHAHAFGTQLGLKRLCNTLQPGVSRARRGSKDLAGRVGWHTMKEQKEDKLARIQCSAEHSTGDPSGL